MRKLVLGLALASSALATPALAHEGAWYVEGDFGAMIVEDTKFTIAGVGGPSLDHSTGFDGGGVLGYDFGMFRLEAEASYRRAKHDNFYNGVNTFDNPHGHSDVLSFMANALLDFGSDTGLQGFVGGGAGVGRVTTTLGYDGPYAFNDTDTSFAWQALAGLRAPITDHVDVGLKYRFFNVDKLRFVDSIGRGVRSKWRSHSLMGTIAYNFYTPAAPPPPPPPPPPPGPPPPPPPPPVCNKGPYIVFFDWDKSDVTPEAATILDSAISAYANCSSVPIMLAGYTDRSGSAKYNLGLSSRRNDSVRGYLTAHGIPDTAISSQAFGESNPRVPTADGVRELQNRRVEITYGPGSGM
jgi:OOP family OmpA-OmpF porin